MTQNISRFFKNGKLQTVPKKMNDKMLLFRFLWEQLKQQGQQFTEKEVNEIIKQFYDDYAILRRYLVDYHFLLRDSYGNVYTVNTLEEEVDGESD